MEKEFKISKHAKERYAERIMKKEDNNDIQRFIILNEEKIISDINQMISYGELIFSGKQQKAERNNMINVYRKKCWVILVDPSTKNVITLYKIDLGVDDEFNNEYVEKMLEKLETAKESKNNIQLEVDAENDNYKALISTNTAMINEYKSYIKNMEELNESYKSIINNNAVKVNMAEAEVVNIVNKLIGKKEF